LLALDGALIKVFASRRQEHNPDGRGCQQSDVVQADQRRVASPTWSATQSHGNKFCGARCSQAHGDSHIARKRRDDGIEIHQEEYGDYADLREICRPQPNSHLHVAESGSRSVFIEECRKADAD